MKFNNDPALSLAISREVTETLKETGIVNVAAIAAALRKHVPSGDVHHIEHAVLGYATLIGAPVLFERALSPESDEAPWPESGGLIIEFTEGNPDALDS